MDYVYLYFMAGILVGVLGGFIAYGLTVFLFTQKGRVPIREYDEEQTKIDLEFAPLNSRQEM